jgi:hypothetical protein
VKYAHEILGLMRPYPGTEFRMAQLVREASGGRALTPRQMEAVRKGVKRVLDHLIETGHVQRVGGGTRAAAYRWHVLGHVVSQNAGLLGQVSGQLR